MNPKQYFKPTNTTYTPKHTVPKGTIVSDVEFTQDKEGNLSIYEFATILVKVFHTKQYEYFTYLCGIKSYRNNCGPFIVFTRNSTDWYKVTPKRKKLDRITE